MSRRALQTNNKTVQATTISFEITIGIRGTIAVERWVSTHGYPTRSVYYGKRSLHEDPSPQPRDCTRNCWSSHRGRHGQIVRCTDQWHVDQGGGTSPDDRRALSGESGLSLRFVLELSHLLLLRISHHLLLLLRVSQLSDLFTILERLRLVVTPGTRQRAAPFEPLAGATLSCQ